MMILFCDKNRNLLTGIQDDVRPFIGDYVNIKDKIYEVKSVLWDVCGDKPKETILITNLEER